MSEPRLQKFSVHIINTFTFKTAAFSAEYPLLLAGRTYLTYALGPAQAFGKGNFSHTKNLTATCIPRRLHL